jgi:hypothetical protein
VQSNIGAVRVLFGWGEKCAYAEPQMIHLASSNPDHKSYAMGTTLFGGADINGDSVPDLMYSAPVGKRVFMLDGAYLKTLTPEPWKQEKEAVETVYELLPNGAAGVELNSWSDSKDFGASMALIGAPFAGMLGGVAVANPLEDVMGYSAVGAVAIYGVTDNGLQPQPWQLVYGETTQDNGRFGISMDYLDTASGGLLAIGSPGAGPNNTPVAVGEGAVYFISVPSN